MLSFCPNLCSALTLVPCVSRNVCLFPILFLQPALQVVPQLMPQVVPAGML